PFAPRSRFYSAADRSSGARPLSVPVEVCLSMRPFPLLQRRSALRQIPAAGSTFLAYIFEAISKISIGPFGFPLPASPGFFSPDRARSLQVARCQLKILEPSVCLRASAPYQDLSILPD